MDNAVKSRGENAAHVQTVGDDMIPTATEFINMMRTRRKKSVSNG